MDMTNMRAILTLILTATFVLSPVFTSPFSGFSADQLPIPQINPPVQPAGYAFSIWGLIYLWLAASAIWGLARRRNDRDWDRARGPLILSLALGTPWLAVANASAVWASVLIFPMAAAAILSLLASPGRDIWLLRVPVAIYAGWLTAAAFVSLGSTAAGFGLLTDATGWAYLCIVMALGVAILVQMRRPDAPAYGATVIWALVAIVIGNGSDPLGVSLLAAAGIAAMSGLLVRGRMQAA